MIRSRTRVPPRRRGGWRAPARLWPAVAALVGLALGLAAPCRADVRSFSAGSVIIPMDSCYQPAADTDKPTGCLYTGTGTDGPIKAYGLVYLLLKRGITIYVITNPDKTSITATDFSITHAGGSGPPVGLYVRGSGAANFMTANTIDYLGAPFVIDVNDAVVALDLLNRDPAIAAFTSVNLHVAYDGFTAPIGMRMNGVPPRVAVFSPPSGQGGSNGTEGIPLMRGYLRRAGLDYAGAAGTPSAPGDIFDLVNRADVLGGAMAASYRIAWLPHYDTPGDDHAVLDAFAAFADRGGMLFAECASIASFEGYNATRFMTTSGIKTNKLPDCYPGNQAGFRGRDGGTYTDCYNPITPAVPSTGQSLEFPLPASPFIQIGDFRFYKYTGTTEDWKPNSGSWRATVQQLMRARDTNNSQNGQALVSAIFKDGDATKGQIIYFGGHFYGDSTGPNTAGIRVVLNTLLFARPSLNAQYLSRSGPTLVTVGGRTLLMQGAYLESNVTLPAFRVAADAVTWPYPQVLGRYQAYDTARLTATQTVGIDTAAVFDAGQLIPGAALRRLYTSAGTGAATRLVDLTSYGLTTLGVTNPLALPAGYSQADVDALVQKLRAAPLGGIDHSQSAVVGAQALIPGGDVRPTVAYVAGLDGMVHAFVVSGGTAPAGTELWALLPGEQLGAVRTNGAVLDASPNVGDTFDVIAGARAWRTMMIVPQGRAGSSVYGIDISNPQSPILRWHRGTAASGVTLGPASGSAMTIHPTTTNPFQSFVLVATGVPSGAPGVTVTALSGADGSQLWQWSHGYSRTLPGTPAVVPNDSPPPVAIGSSGGRYQDRVYVADLEGRIWELDTATGRNVNGTSPLADVGLTAAGRTQPIGASPTLYINRDTGHRSLVVVTGGADWADATDTYAVYAFDLATDARVRDQGAGVAPRLFRTAMAAGLKGYAPPSISGNDLYVMGSSGVINGAISTSMGDAATLYRINLGGGTATASVALTKGAGAFLTSGGMIYGSTARDLVVIGTGGADANGRPLGEQASSPLRQRVYLETIN